MGKVIDFLDSQNRQAQEVLECIMDLPEDKFIDFLRQIRQEFSSRGEDENGISFVNLAIQLRVQKLRELCLE
jgi:hypothetical protein